jgi:ferrochelatase
MDRRRISAIAHTRKQSELLQERTELPVYYSMRYGNPSTAGILQKMHEENPALEQIILLPLYPHYAMSSYETAVEQVKQLHAWQNILPFLQNC